MMFGHKQLASTRQQEQEKLLYQYKCLNCGNILKETSAPIDKCLLSQSLKQCKERCAGCDSLLQEQTIEQITLYPLGQRQQLREKHQKGGINISTSTLTAPILEIAYDIGSTRLTFDIPKLDFLLSNYMTDKGAICIISNNNYYEDLGGNEGKRRRKHSSSDSNCDRYANLLTTRLCVRALMSKKQGGFESPAVIFVDAGNCSDIYQCVNFARQYGMDIDNMLDRIIVSRPFTIHQLAALIIKELEERVMHSAARLVIISDILKMFNQDPQLDAEEANRLIREISRSLHKLSTQTIVVVAASFIDKANSSSTNGTEKMILDDSQLLKTFDTCINLCEIPTKSASKSVVLQVQVDKYRKNNDRISLGTTRTIQLHQSELLIVPAR